MLRKKVVIKSKSVNEPLPSAPSASSASSAPSASMPMFPIKKRTVAPVQHKITTTVGPVNSIPSRVYNLTKKTEPSTSAAYIVNNIVKLKLHRKPLTESKMRSLVWQKVY